MISCALISIVWLLICWSRKTSAQLSQGTAQRQSDVQYLLLLRSSITNWADFATANNIVGWNASQPVCTWTGIDCTDTGDIAGVSLQCGHCQVRAQGTLPAELAHLSALVTLDLQGQLFTGGVPRAWFATDAWPTLQNLFLANNPLGGALPESQSGSLTSLIQLNLDDCDIAGPLPLSWGQDETSMRQLSVLRAANNLLNGTLPPEWGTSGALPQLTTLDLSNNSLLGTLPNLWSSPQAAQFLQELYLQENNFTGGLPPGFGQGNSLRSLRYLSLASNPLGGELPAEWSQTNSFAQLKSLDLNNTGLSGPLPANMPAAFPNLDSMRLAYNNLSGPIPASFANFTNLQRLIIKPGNPFLCGPLPSQLPFQLCDDRDLSCRRIPVELLPQCPPNLEPAAEPVLSISPPSTFTAPSATGELPASGTTTTSSDGSGSSSTGAIVGGVVGGVVGLALLATAGILIARSAASRRRKSEGADLAGAQSKPSYLPFFSESDIEDGALSDRGTGRKPFSGGAETVAQIGTKGVVAQPHTAPSKSSLNVGSSAPLSVVLAKLKTSSGREGNGTSQYISTVAPKWPSSEKTPSFRESGETSGTGVVATTNASAEVLPWNDWQINPEELEVCHRPDGTDWVIGSGGFGKVYKALRNGVQPVAVKIIPAPSDDDWRQRRQVRNEVSILRACRDANIVQFQGAYLSPEQTLLVTEYMEGGNLMDNLTRGRVTWWRRGLKIAIDVAKGLVFLHSRRIVHFDLKSPNILLGRDGTAKIADVGMAKFLAHDYVTGVVATLAWSAPEMLWGSKCTEKADIYSYGIVLWEICTGEAPERGRLRDVRVPEECPPEVRDLILLCLETRPSLRPSALQIVEWLRKIPAGVEQPQPMEGSTETEASNVGTSGPGNGPDGPGASSEETAP